MTDQTVDAGQIDAELEVFDAFTVEDSIVGDVRDPYPQLHEQRAESSVRLLSSDWYIGMPEQDHPVFMVTGADEVEAILKDGETYSSKILGETMGPVMGHTILEMGEPEHLRHRSLIAQAFRMRALTRWESELIGPLVTELIDGFASKGRADLVRDFTLQFPMKVIARILGLPREDWVDFMKLSLELISITVNWDRAIAASRELRGYFTSILDDRRVSPQDDLISELVQAEVDGHTLTDDEILPFLNLLLPAGAETTLRSLGNLFTGLLSDPERWNRVRDDRGLVPTAIEEALRWEPPLLILARETSRPTTLGGVDLPEAARLVVHIGAAGRDPSRHENPDEYDLDRDDHHHVAFGTGPHACLGMHLARMEMSLALNALMDRLPDLHLDPDGEDVHIHGLTFRSPPRLPVVFTPEG